MWCLTRMCVTKGGECGLMISIRMNASIHTFDVQVWSCLPAFVSWADDLPSSYASYVKVWGLGVDT